MKKPIIALTMGDGAGIGPELILKVLCRPEILERCQPIVIADRQVMEATARAIGVTTQFDVVASVAEAKSAPGRVPLLPPDGEWLEPIPWGKLEPGLARLAAQCLERAFRLAAAGEVHGVVSAPLNKQGLHLAGYDYTDDLAYLADITHSPNATVLGVIGDMWVAQVTEHIPFRDILPTLTRERIVKTIRGLYRALRKVGVDRPRLAVAALNVHAGEGGLFGNEESEIVSPAIATAAAEGIEAYGPFPADTIFLTALDQQYEGVVCLYHDQANIARKLIAKRSGATMYMGLPVVCGTTAHGTAYDKAGQGISEPDSLLVALDKTILLASV